MIGFISLNSFGSTLIDYLLSFFWQIIYPNSGGRIPRARFALVRIDSFGKHGDDIDDIDDEDEDK